MKKLRPLTILTLFFTLNLSIEVLAREVELSWEPFESAIGYQVMIAKTPDFSEPLVKKNVKTPEINVPLEVGTYFYRVRAVDKDKTPGHWSEPMKFDIAPYPPELLAPKTESHYTFYEIPPKITFQWKEVEGNPEYEILVTKTTGKKAFEGKTTALQLDVTTLEEGEYFWKVRTHSKGLFVSPHGEPRRFTVERLDFAKPELKSPSQGMQVPAYQGINLEWKNDPNMHFSDLAVSFKSEEEDKVIKLDPPKNLKEETQYYLDLGEPGEYKWKVRSKEGPDTKGKESEVGSFRVRKDLISDSNWSFYSGAGLFNKSLESKSKKTTPEGSAKIDASGYVATAGGTYYVSSGLGFQMDFYHGDIKQGDWSLPESGFSGTARFRMGTPGFNQQFFLGYKQMNEYEIIEEPVKSYNLYSVNGGVVGTQLLGTLSRRFRLGIEGSYFKPMSYQEAVGKLTGDVYEASVQLSYNLTYKFWVSYQFLYQKSVFQAVQKNSPDEVNTKWDTTRTIPLLIRLSYEN